MSKTLDWLVSSVIFTEVLGIAGYSYLSSSQKVQPSSSLSKPFKKISADYPRESSIDDAILSIGSITRDTSPSVSTADMNGDGRNDIVLAYNSSTMTSSKARVEVWYNQGDGTYTTKFFAPDSDK